MRRKKNKDCASMPIAPASTAVMVMVRLSRFFHMPQFMRQHARTSSRFKRRIKPLVAATAAFSGLRPVAKRSLVALDQIDFRHRHPAARRQLFDDRVQRGALDRLRAVHAQHQLVEKQ